MIRLTAATALSLITTGAVAHELTPTYPKMVPSYVEDVVTTRMHIFNRRTDVVYYQIGVFDEDWNPIPFASQTETINVPHLGHKDFDIYIRESDIEEAEFICTTSRLKSDDIQSSGVKSKICSRIK